MLKGERERIERKCKAREFGAVLYSNACLVFLYEESRNLFEEKEKEKKEVKLLFLLWVLRFFSLYFFFLFPIMT